MSMTDEKVKRINELYHKAKAEGLTETEKKEQALLREEYIASFRKNLRSQPRVFKNKHMGGHYGVDRVTVQNLEVVSVDAERDLLLVKGAVPGANEGLLVIRDTVK